MSKVSEIISKNIGNAITNVQTWGGVIINVKSYGAVGDGATDDTAVIQAAIDAVSSTYGGVVYFPPGTYLISSQLTISNNYVTLEGNATIKAKNSTDFEIMLWATGLSNIIIYGLTFDVNQANRVSSLTTRSVGIYLSGVTDSLVENVIVKNAIGYTSVAGFGIAVASSSVRSHVRGCTIENCGITGKAADGIFVSGTQCTIDNGTAVSCNDTGFVIESSNQSGISNCTARSCSVGGAITNALSTDVRGNYINVLDVYDWSSSVVGGMQISALGSGDLRNTNINGVTIECVAGAGPAITFREPSTGNVDGVVFSNFRIEGAGNQGFVIKGTDIKIQGGRIVGTTGTPIQIQSGSSDIEISKNKIKTGAGISFVVYSDGANDVVVNENIINGNSVASYGVFFDNSATGCKAHFNVIKNVNTARIGSHASTTIDVVATGPNGNEIVFGKEEDTNIKRAAANTLKTDDKLISALGIGVGNSVVATTLGTVNKSIPYFDASGTLLCYVPGYDAIT